MCFTLSLPRNCKYEIFLFLLRQFIVDSIEFNDSINVVQCINDKTLFLIHRDSSQYSAVCAYKIKDIKTMFSKGKFMAPVTVETSFVKWVMYSGDVPDPRPGAVSLLFSNSVQHLFYNTDCQSSLTFTLFSIIVH